MSKPVNRSWGDKFRDAFRGIFLAIRGGSSCAIHLFATVAVCICAVLLECDRIEWCLLIGCIGAVFAVEVLNDSLETLFHALDEATKARMIGCLDRAAGAVLITAITSSVIGVLILGRRMLISTRVLVLMLAMMAI